MFYYKRLQIVNKYPFINNYSKPLSLRLSDGVTTVKEDLLKAWVPQGFFG